MKFHDENGNIKESLVLEDAMIKAVGFVKQSISSAQLRKFYNEFKTIEKTLQVKASPEKAFAQVKPKIKLTVAKVEYAGARKSSGKKLVPESFETWLKDCVQSIDTYEDFNAFLLHFEAVVGFAYGAGLSDKS